MENSNLSLTHNDERTGADDMAERAIEISSDESDVEDDSNTRLTNIEFPNNAIIKKDPESSECKNCTYKCSDINNHLSDDCACFFPLTEKYWYKQRGEEQVCRICEENLKDDIKLKKHCFENETCREMYIMYYVKQIPCRENATVVSADTDVKYEVSSSSHQKVGHPEISSKRDNEMHTLPGTSGSFYRKQDTGTRVRTTSAVKPSAAANVSNNAEATSTSAPDVVEEQRATKRKRPRNLTCGQCNKQYASADKFLIHAMKKSICYSHYETTENTDVTVWFCFKCKRGFKTCTLCIEHQCIGLVKYQCSQCDEIFDSISSLKDHESSTH